MLLYEYDEKKHLRNTYEEGRREGVIKGRKRSPTKAPAICTAGAFPVRDTAEILEEKEETVAAWYKKWEKR